MKIIGISSIKKVKIEIMKYGILKLEKGDGK